MLILFIVSRQEIVGWLQQQIAEQKRSDLTTSGVHTSTDNTQSLSNQKDGSNNTDIQLLLPGDIKKQRKQTKQIFRDRGLSITFLGSLDIIAHHHTTS